jgi:hypothetical protein
VPEEMEKIWKKTAVAAFKTLVQHMPGGTELNHEIFQAGN